MNLWITIKFGINGGHYRSEGFVCVSTIKGRVRIISLMRSIDHVCKRPLPWLQTDIHRIGDSRTVQAGEHRQTSKGTDGLTDGRTLPSALSPCFAKALRSINVSLLNYPSFLCKKGNKVFVNFIWPCGLTFLFQQGSCSNCITGLVLQTFTVLH